MKKAQMMNPRRSISLLIGVIFISLGVIPILHSFGVIGFVLPPIPELVVRILAIIGGVFLFLDGLGESQTAFQGFPQYMMYLSYLLGFGIIALGIIPLLNTFGVIGFTLPSFGQIILDGLYLVVGLLLLYGGTQGF